MKWNNAPITTQEQVDQGNHMVNNREEHNAIRISQIYRPEGQKGYLLLWVFLLSIILQCTSVLDYI